MIILLIEDSISVATMLIRSLRRRGHEVTHVESTRDARAYLDQRRPDVVVTDRDVKDGDAWAFINAQDVATRVVFMSGNAPTTPPRAFFYKGSDNITKLFDLVEAPHGA